MRRLKFIFFAFLLTCAAATFASPAALLPGDSLYQTPLALQDQQGRHFDLASMRGHPIIVSMFYASCDSACPLTFETIERIRRAASAPGRTAPSVLMISFDPKHDAPAKLAEMARMHELGPPFWRLTRPVSGDVMAFAATLGVAYRRRADGEFSHNVVIALLDENGRIIARSSVVGQLDPAFVDAVRKEIAGH